MSLRVMFLAHCFSYCLNPDKSCALFIGSPTSIFQTSRHIEMRYDTQAKTLRLVINSTLTWSGHISGISQRVHRTLRLLHYSKRSLSFTLHRRLADALIFLVFDYVTVVYRTVLKAKELKLQRLLNACVRFTYENLPGTAHVTLYRIALGWLMPRLRRDYLLGTFVFLLTASGVPRDPLEWIHLLAKSTMKSSSWMACTIFYYPTARTSWVVLSEHQERLCRIF